MHQYLESCVDDKNSEENTKLLADKYGNNQFSEEKYHHRIYMEKQEIKSAQQHQPSQQLLSSSQVTCPYCKSTNTKKISAVSRAESILGFGLFSKKLGKEWHCNNCNSDF